MTNFINTYQTLIGTFVGSFLAILSSVLLWFLKEGYEKRKLTKNNRDEIDSIFFMAGRDSEEAVRDMAHVIPNIREGTTKMTSEKNLLFLTPQKLNRVFISEERLTTLKQGLDLVTQQQVDIAISAVKKFNGYLENFESIPMYIFDSNIKLINSFPHIKEEAVKMYKENIEAYLAHFEEIIPLHIETAQRNMLRPIVAQANKDNIKRFNNDRSPELDDKLNTMSALILSVIKEDLK